MSCLARSHPVLQEPELVSGILKSIQSISDEARRALADPELPRDSLLSTLSVSAISGGACDTE